jgi:hypothetical protein
MTDLISPRGFSRKSNVRIKFFALARDESKNSRAEWRKAGKSHVPRSKR